MGFRGLLNMTLVLLAVLFGSMVLVGEQPRSQGSNGDDDLASLAEALETNGVTAVTADTSKALALTAPEEPQDAVVETASVTTATPEPEAVVQPAVASTETTVGVPTPVKQTEVEQITPTVRFAIVLGNRVNVRSGPSTQNGVIGKVVKNQEVELLGYSENGWANIIVNGEEGFMSGDFLREKIDG